MINYLALIIAIAISAVAAWYSIVGLIAIFAAAAIPIAIMGTVLEIGKLVSVSWLYQNWKQTPVLLKSYLVFAVVVLMFITSLGIFGFLSKAHIDQTLQGGDNTLQITLIENRIKNEQRIIKDAENVIKQLDTQVETLIEFARIRGPDGSIATRQSQRGERSDLNGVIDKASSSITTLNDEAAGLRKEQLKLEADVGPIRYIAELFYHDKADRDVLETAVRWVIIVIIWVFDPLAVLLLIAANQGLMLTAKRRKRYYSRKGSVELKSKDILNIN